MSDYRFSLRLDLEKTEYMAEFLWRYHFCFKPSSLPVPLKDQ